MKRILPLILTFTCTVIGHGDWTAGPARLQGRSERPGPLVLRDCLRETFPDGPAHAASMQAHLLLLDQYLRALPENRNRQRSRRTSDVSAGSESEVMQRIERMCDYLLYMSMPDGSLPLWGASTPPLRAFDLLLRGADSFSRQDMRWVGTRGKHGKRPAVTSVAFPDAGYYVMRSGWDPAASFLALHNGAGQTADHRDANSFVLAGYGSPLLIDPGAHPVDGREGVALSESSAHNTVTPDDCNTRSGPGRVVWRTGPLMDVYDGTNAGYACPSEDGSARHRRRIVFVKPSLFFVVDDLYAERPHDWTLRFHFAAGKLSFRPGAHQLVFQTAVADAANSAAPVEPGGADVARVPSGLQIWTEEERNPEFAQLQCPAGQGRTGAIPVASWTHRASRTSHFASLLMPFGEEPALDQWIVRSDDAGAAVAAGPSDGVVRSVLRVRRDPTRPVLPGEGRNVELETDADVAYLQSGPRSRDVFDEGRPSIPIALAVVNCRSLRWRSTASGARENGVAREAAPLFSAIQKVESLTAFWLRDTIRVFVSGGQGVVLSTYGARWIAVNEKQRTAIPPGVTQVTVDPGVPAKGVQ